MKNKITLLLCLVSFCSLHSFPWKKKKSKMEISTESGSSSGEESPPSSLSQEQVEAMRDVRTIIGGHLFVLLGKCGEPAAESSEAKSLGMIVKFMDENYTRPELEYCYLEKLKREREGFPKK